MVEYTMVLGDKGLSLGSLATSIIEAGRTPVDRLQLTGQIF